MVIGSLTTNIVADLSKWGPNLNKARGQMASFTKSITSMQNVIGGLVAGAAASFLKTTIDQADALHDTAQILRVNVEQLQAYRQLAEESGSSARTMDRALGFLNKTLGQAANGSGMAAEKFRMLGLDIKQLSGQSVGTTFMQISDAIRTLPTDAQQSAAAVALLGRAGQELLPIIRSGSSEIQRFQQALQANGGIASAEAIAKAAAFSDAIKQITNQFTVLKIEVVSVLGPAINFFLDDVLLKLRLIQKTLQAIRELSPRFGQWAAGSPGAGLLPLAGTLPANFPGNPAIDRSLPVNQPRTPAISGSANWIGDNQSQFMQNVNRVFNMLPGRIQGAIMQGVGAKLPAPVENFFEGIGRFIGQGGLMANPAKALGMVPGFELARSGSADSYRQQVRIERQGSGNNKLEQIGNKQLNAQNRTATATEKLANMFKGGVELVAANFGG